MRESIKKLVRHYHLCALVDRIKIYRCMCFWRSDRCIGKWMYFILEQLQGRRKRAPPSAVKGSVPPWIEGYPWPVKFLVDKHGIAKTEKTVFFFHGDVVSV